MLPELSAVVRSKDMDQKELKAKLDGILEAIAAGRTCEQILAADHTLSYRDIFHALAEAPTRFWRKASVTSLTAHSPQPPKPQLINAWHRTD